MIHRRGFTLIELVIVIAIIGILASLAIPKYIDLSYQSKVAASKAGLAAVRAALATKYAASATSGQPASYPTALAASDFAGAFPQNRLPVAMMDCVWAVASPVPSPSAEMMGCDWWFVSDPASSDYGKAGAFSEGASGTDTSDW